MSKKQKSFSDQIRDAIKNCGTTRYALAEQVGVNGSVLSRFMAGTQGMTLETLDKLAEALGLEVITTVENVKRPKPKGRKPAKELNMVAAAGKLTRIDWNEMARKYAEYASTNHFESRRGVWLLESVGKLCVYNNNPYQKGKHFRDEEIADFRSLLKEKGINELGFGTAGDDDFPDYTFAMILDCGKQRLEWVVDTWKEIVRETSMRLNTAEA